MKNMAHFSENCFVSQRIFNKEFLLIKVLEGINKLKYIKLDRSVSYNYKIQYYVN